MTDKELSSKVIGIAIDVHRTIGPGLLESAYRECLYHELRANHLQVQKEKPMPIIYKDIRLDHGYRIDLLVENNLVIEIKTVESLTDVHLAQMLTYLRFGNYRFGLLINFHVSLLKNGLQRVINDRRLPPIL
jgi:GxxExxY protein